MDAIRLLLVDDHEIVRAGIRALLESREDMEVVGEAASGDEALDLAVELRPDVVLMDISMPGMSGDDATRQILRRVSETNVVALSVHEEEAYFYQMFQAGACGYVPKRAAPRLLLSAIRAAAEGEVFLDPSVASSLVQTCLGRKRRGAGPAAYDGLTARQRQVLTLVAEGFSNRQISEKLDISIHTVQRHRANIRRQLDLDGGVDLVKYALRKGLIQLDEDQ
ncbi:MAG: response regulator transcription factor [Anaerolineae bacterium]|jgi:two-component system response regulator NreC